MPVRAAVVSGAWLGPSGVSLEDSLIGLTPLGRLLSPGTYGAISRMPGQGVGRAVVIGATGVGYRDFFRR